MAAALKLRTDYSALDLSRLVPGSRHANQSRFLLSLAAVLDGVDREQAARISGTDLYAPDRNAEQPIRHLQGFTGVLQADGYAGTLQAGSPAIGRVKAPVLRFDLAGVARSATASASGDYEKVAA
jgi:hypothetical protein